MKIKYTFITLLIVFISSNSYGQDLARENDALNKGDKSLASPETNTGSIGRPGSIEIGKKACPDLLGVIKIQNAARYCNDVKLDFFFDAAPGGPQINTITWTFFDEDGTTVLFSVGGTGATPTFTFNYPASFNGNALVQVDINYANNCSAQFQRTFFVSDCDLPCVNAYIPENHLVDLLQHIVTRLQAGDTAADINGTTPVALTNLSSFLIDTNANGVINNFNIESVGRFSFSFSSNHNDDVIFKATVNAINDLNLSGMDLDFNNYSGPQGYTNFPPFQTPSGNNIKSIDIRHINFCSDPIAPSNNLFCTSEMDNYPTIGDLTPSGANIEWFITETGGIALSNSEDLAEEAEDPTGVIYWWDDVNDNNPNRVEVTAYINSGVLDSGGDGDNDYDYQEFTEGQNATVANLIPVGSNIKWYDAPFSNIPLSSITPLINGAVYYVEEVGVTTCRLEVDIFIGTKPPTGDEIQYLCEGQTIEDIIIVPQDTVSTIVWYANETGGPTIPTSTILSNNGTYYAAQIDGDGFESQQRLGITIYFNSVSQPEVPFSTQVFDINQTPPPTVADLIAFGFNIQWYPQQIGGNVYSPIEPLEHGVTYWAEQNIGSCPSTRVPVLIQIIDIPEPPLIGCEKFKPQPGDRYVVNAWVREQAVIPINPEVNQFNNSLESDLFVDLLNHLLFVTQNYENDIHDITQDGYIPTHPTDVLDFDPLVPFVKLIGDEIRLKVYDYKRLLDDYGAEGNGRTIGFEFKLSNHENAPTFRWESLPIVLNQGTSYQETINYPLNDNNNSPDLDIQFTDAIVQGNTIILVSNFIANGSPAVTQMNYAYTSISGLEASFTKYDYEEIPNFQPIKYMNTLVELIYKDNLDVVIPLPEEEIKFEPKGEIIDGWQRVYAEFRIPPNAAEMTINLKNKSETDNIAYFDDIRMHPYESNMKTFVYHPETQRLMSELDENNYATFYEYDAEGGLIRVKKETEKGIYTIQETRSSTTKLNN